MDHGRIPNGGAVLKGPHEDPLAIRERILTEADRLLVASKVEEARACLRGMASATIDERTLIETDRMFVQGLRSGRRLVATCGTSRTARPGEQVVIYGNSPYCLDNLLVNDVARRHVSWFWRLKHDIVESHPAWDSIGPIFLINQDSRPDRLDAVLNELARAKAPLDRVERFPAVEIAFESLPDATPQFRATVGCLKSHIAVLERITKNTYGQALVLEDDFSFTSDMPVHLDDLKSFVERRYDYWICLLGTSKYGVIVERDDLVSCSLQPCTNTEAYLISPAGLEALLPLWRRSLQGLLETRDPLRFAADRAWAELQPSGKFLVFRRKMGFQASSFSASRDRSRATSTDPSPALPRAGPSQCVARIPSRHCRPRSRRAART